MNKLAAALALGTALAAGTVALLRRQDGSPPSASVPVPGSRTANGTSSKILRRILEGGEPPRPTPEQLGGFVERQKRSAASLLAAWQIGGDPAWLDEAAERYPDDPRVALAKVGILGEGDAAAREWIGRLRRADPGNALGWCHEALLEFRDGSPAAARAALAEAARLGRFDGYTKESAAALAEAYRAAGLDGFAAEVVGGFSVPIPHAGVAMRLSREAVAKLGPNLDDRTVHDLLALARSVRAGGGTGYLITDLVSAAMERKVLAELSMAELVPGTRKFVLERIAELDGERKMVQELVARSEPLLRSLDDAGLKQYYRRLTVEGEMKALQWLLSRSRGP